MNVEEEQEHSGNAGEGIAEEEKSSSVQGDDDEPVPMAFSELLPASQFELSKAMGAIQRAKSAVGPYDNNVRVEREALGSLLKTLQSLNSPEVFMAKDQKSDTILEKLYHLSSWFSKTERENLQEVFQFVIDQNPDALLWPTSIRRRYENDEVEFGRVLHLLVFGLPYGKDLLQWIVEIHYAIFEKCMDAEKAPHLLLPALGDGAAIQKFYELNPRVLNTLYDSVLYPTARNSVFLSRGKVLVLILARFFRQCDWDGSLEAAFLRLLEICPDKNDAVNMVYLTLERITSYLEPSLSSDTKDSYLRLGKALIERHSSLMSIHFDSEFLPPICYFTDEKCAQLELQELALRLLRSMNVENIEAFLTHHLERRSVEHNFVSAMYPLIQHRDALRRELAEIHRICAVASTAHPKAASAMGIYHGYHAQKYRNALAATEIMFFAIKRTYLPRSMTGGEE
jgi:hypothetical protein